MKVLVLGASGFIGLPVALAYARAGHIVYGTARDAKTARKLAIHEIIPVVTPATAGHGFSVWSKIAAEVDVSEYHCRAGIRQTGATGYRVWLDLRASGRRCW
jgi:nucleoside-diphosphate-sugar epimerase